MAHKISKNNFVGANIMFPIKRRLKFNLSFNANSG